MLPIRRTNEPWLARKLGGPASLGLLVVRDEQLHPKAGKCITRSYHPDPLAAIE